ncbi:hypothetical protein [Burkholderia gladioli]|uniref:hypothetical protein n=1 Tax=Burkholderia gladioli TaxID=28095 RepID=UPI0011B20778|nr:hypothetical protein [Burkholderia gladioli]
MTALERNKAGSARSAAAQPDRHESIRPMLSRQRVFNKKRCFTAELGVYPNAAKSGSKPRKDTNASSPHEHSRAANLTRQIEEEKTKRATGGRAMKRQGNAGKDAKKTVWKTRAQTLPAR